MSRRRRKRKGLGYTPTLLLKHHVGKVKCERYGNLKLCVIGGKYGFSGRLYAKGSRRKWLPVSVGNARTPQEALRQGKKFLGRVHGKNN